MPRPKTYDDGLRLRLLDEAGRMLAEHGADGLSLRSVAAAADTSTTAIYSLFGGKADLIRELYLEGFRRLADHLARVVPDLDPDGPGDPIAHIVALGEAYIDSALASPHLYSVMFGPAVADACMTDDDAVFALSTLTTLVDAVRVAVDTGILLGEADTIATMLWVTVHGAVTLTISGLLPADAAREVAREAGAAILATRAT